MSNDYADDIFSYDPSDTMWLANRNINSINYGISLTMNHLKTRRFQFNRRADVDSPLVSRHLLRASNAILSAASHEGNRHKAKAQASVDSSLLHYREAAKHLMISNQDKSVVMNPGLRYLEETGAPRDMIERHLNWQNDEAILGSESANGKMEKGKTNG